MNEPADQAAVAASTTAPPQGAEPAAPVPTPPPVRRRGRPKPQRSRQTRVVVRKLGPWSVLKLSFLFYLCVMVVFLGAMMILYGILSAIGALDSLTRLIRDLFADRSFEIHGDWLFTRGLAVGLGMVVLWTIINVFVVFLYNLLSDIVGGIEVTLSERR